MKPLDLSISRTELRMAPRKRDRLEERKQAIEAFIANRGPTTINLSDREQKRAHGTNHRHGAVKVYR